MTTYQHAWKMKDGYTP